MKHGLFLLNCKVTIRVALRGFCALGVTSFLSDHMIAGLGKMSAMGIVRCLFFSIFLSYFLANSANYHVPVLIWGQNYDFKGDSFSSIARLSSDQFSNYILKNIHKENSKASLVVFVEETLSVEDFSVKDIKGEGSFPLLKNLVGKHKLDFLPSVVNPVAALTGLGISSYGFTVSEVNGNNIDASNFPGKHNMIYLVSLDDADSKEDRPQMLHRHDAKITKIFDELAKNKNIIAVLTGRYSSWTEPQEIIRVRRQANESTLPNETEPTGKEPLPSKPSKGIILETKTALIYSKTAPVLEINGQKIVLDEMPTSWVSFNCK